VEKEGGVWREREERGRERSVEGERRVWREREECGERGMSVEGEAGVFRKGRSVEG